MARVLLEIIKVKSYTTRTEFERSQDMLPESVGGVKVTHTLSTFKKTSSHQSHAAYIPEFHSAMLQYDGF
jgi:hypothetical protein